jgi:aspartyl-tRNA(Asn)/glutamyl-tRNA(Gln) amidotransferase subunit C
VAVSESDLRHVAALARLGLDEARIPALVRELNGILDHMHVLEGVDGGDGRWEVGGAGFVPAMRSDVSGLAIPLAVPRESFAPEMRDGFFLVPRLATHEDEGERSP